MPLSPQSPGHSRINQHLLDELVHLPERAVHVLARILAYGAVVPHRDPEVAHVDAAAQHVRELERPHGGKPQRHRARVLVPARGSVLVPVVGEAAARLVVGEEAEKVGKVFCV